MASMLFNKADQMKQRLRRSLAAAGGLSCSSAVSTSVFAFSSGRAIDRHSPHPRRRITAPSVPNNSSSSTKLKLKKTTTTTSPASSSRYLLNSSRLQLEQSGDGDVTILDSLPPLPSPSFIDDFFPVVTDQLERADAAAAAAKDDDDEQQQQQQAVIGTRRSTSCSTRGQHQVVVLKVSLHCKGCAGKVKKHISKMEGVTSFDIDIATKKVTVMGDVTPLGVLNCISKVKSAQFWPASSSSSPPRASASF